MGDLRNIPGVGASIERDFLALGIHSIADLRGRDPEDIFREHCHRKGLRDDRCLLYVFRLAVWFAEHDRHEPDKLKWWYWKDRSYPPHDGLGERPSSRSQL